MLKRLSAVLLGLALIVQGLPVTAHAAEEAASSSPAIVTETTATIAVQEVSTSTVRETASSSAVVRETVSSTVSSEQGSEEAQEDEDNDTIDTENDADLDLHKNLEGIVRQSQPYTCGPASLATLLSQLGDDTTEADVLQHAPANPTDGVSLFALKQAAVSLGHTAVLKKWTPDQLADYLKQNEDPILIHDLKPGVGGHFSVVRDIKDGTVYLSDTEAGNITYSFADFGHVFTGYALIVDSDSSSAVLADASTDLSDDEAKTITGKYVPVAIAAQNNGASKDAAAFSQCMKEAASLSTTAARRTKQTQCYSALGSALSTVSLGTEAAIAFQAGPSLTGIDFAKDLQYTINSETFKKLDTEKNQAQAAVKIAEQTLQKAKETATKTQAVLQQAQAKQQQVVQSNAVIAGKKADYQNQLSGKQSTLAALNSQISSAKLNLGSITASISAAATNLGNLSKSLQTKLANTQAQITSKQSTLRSLQQEITNRQNTINSYNNQINTLQSTINYKKSRRQSYSYEQNQLNNLQYRLQSEQSSLNRAQSTFSQTQRDITSLQQQLSSGSNQVALEQAAMNALKQKQQLAQQDLDRKQAELPRIQNDIAILTVALSKLPQPAPVPSVDYAPYNQAVSAQNQAQTTYNNAVTRYNQAVQAIQDEKNFIDAQEKALDNKIEKDVVARPVVTVTNFVQNGVIFAAGMSYQIVDSSLFNTVTNASKIAGVDINSIRSLPFQVGRETGNTTVLGLSLLGITGGTGTTAAGATMLATGTGLCVATLASGGIMLVPCAVSTAAGGATTLIGAGVTAVSGAVLKTSTGNQEGIAKAVENASGNVNNNSGQVGSKINVTPQSLSHVTDSHLPGGSLSDGKSLFGKDENLLGLIQKSENVAAIKQVNGNYARVLDAGRIIGVDRTTGAQTRIYTVITDTANNLVTMFPGNP